MSMASCGKMTCLLALRQFRINHVTIVSSMSTKPAHATQESFSHFRTSESNPIAHTSAHIGKVYTIPPDVKNRLFVSGGIPRALDTQMKTFRESCLIVRQPAIEVMSYLKKINFSDPAVRIVLYGNLGVGKTTTLAHVLHYGYLSNFLLLHLPWVSIWTKRPKEVVASQYNENRIDLPVESAIWLQHFKSQNGKLMEELDLRTSKSYTWSKREVTEEGASLMDIVEHGIQRVRHSSDCVATLLKEIKIQSSSGKYKTMVLIDGVNAFWCHTNVKKPDKSLVPPCDITITRAFMKIVENDWNNSVIITSIDKLPPNRNCSMLDPYTPRFLLGKEGFELMTPFIPIHVGNYTDREFTSIMDYYCDRLWIDPERTRGEDGRKQLRFLSGYNPEELMRLCNPL